MDRFIVYVPHSPLLTHEHLKSNMDRFIDLSLDVITIEEVYLKSNMDRFIGWYSYFYCC